MKFTRPKRFPGAPDVDGLIAELRDRLTKIEAQLARVLKSLKVEDGPDDDGR